MAVTISNVLSGISSLSIDPAGGRAFVDVGYLSGPVTLEYNSEQEKVDVEQDTVPIKHLLKIEGGVLKANMAEATLANFKNVYGYIDTDSVADTGIVGPVTPIFVPQNFSAKLVATGPSATPTRTVIFPRLCATGNVGTPFTKSAIQTLPVEFSALRAHKETSNWANNGTFTGNATGWTLVTWAYGSNAVAIAAAGTGTVTQSVTNLLPGYSYTLTYTLSAFSAGGVRPSLGGTNGTNQTVAGTYTESIVAGSSNTNLVFTGTAATATLDTVYLVPDFAIGFQDA